MPQSHPQSASVRTGDRSRTDTVRHLRRLSHLLDNAIPIPGTKYRLGLDPILGLLPGGGDVAGAALSAYIVYRAAQMGLPTETVRQMAGNVLIEMLVGIFPVLGDLFDVGWKANVRNVKLLEEHIDSPEPTQAADKRLVFLIVAGIVLVAVALAAITVAILRFLLSLLG